MREPPHSRLAIEPHMNRPEGVRDRGASEPEPSCPEAQIVRVSFDGQQHLRFDGRNAHSQGNGLVSDDSVEYVERVRVHGVESPVRHEAFRQIFSDDRRSPRESPSEREKFFPLLFLLMEELETNHMTDSKIELG